MKDSLKLLRVIALGLALATNASFAQTDGGARLETTLLDYNGSSARHWTVVWVTTSSGAFIKSLRKQGPGWTSTHWDSHCSVWNTARGGSASGSQALDGYSSATAQDYGTTATNNPIVWTWNCRDANNNPVANGDYKFWVQYAEDNGQGPYTTSGLLWTKGPSAATTTYPNQGANFSNMKVVWTPAAVSVPPAITSAAPPSSGTVGVPYSYTCAATGTTPVTFGASGLPAGLTISSSGVISGTPKAGGAFNGTITAANGTVPNATQGFSITINVVPARFTSVRAEGTRLVMSGTGPANGTYAVLTSSVANASPAQWSPVVTNSIGAGGSFNYTNTPGLSVPRTFYRLRVP